MLPRFAKKESSRSARSVSKHEPDGETREPIFSEAAAEECESAEEARRPPWRKTFKRTQQKIAEDNLSIVAAGVAFYVFLGIIPALGALISIYGLLFDPAMIEKQLSSL